MRLIALALVVLALATGCSQDGTPVGASAPRSTSSTPTATPRTDRPAEQAARYPTYVALGDSYTAAPLVPDTDVTNGCLRSSGNYPARVAAALPGTRLVDVSCSGADTTSMTEAQQTGNQAQPPQLDALSRRTDLVTLGIGGNDFQLFGTLIGTCSRLRSSDPQGSPCHAQLAEGGSDRLTRDLQRIAGHVAAVVAGIRGRAPHARVVVVGYPQIVPAHGTCPALPLATGDYPYARRINAGLARAVQRGARQADGYVDLFRASAGHDICAAHPWINGRATDAQRALAFHPFAVEQQAAARLVLAQL